MIATTQESYFECSLRWANLRILYFISCREYKQILTCVSPDSFNRWLFPLKMQSTISPASWDTTSGKMHPVTSKEFFSDLIS
jgi:hypothetical protein